MVDADHVRLGRIADKLAAARAMPAPPKAFGVAAHGFRLGPSLPEAVVVEFEERHEVLLPPAYRLFVTELGDGGAGPGYRLLRLTTSCCKYRRSGHLARPSPYLPGPRYVDDWEQRYEDPPGPDRVFLAGTLGVADHGCSLATCLVVTGPARGRLLNLDHEGPVGPYVVEDADFLAWYERWLDETVAGYDVDWFGERLPLEEPELIAALVADPSPERRTRAGESLLQLPAISENAWTALNDAMTTDVDAAVRASIWSLLRWQRHDRERQLGNADTIADEIEAYARSDSAPNLRTLSFLDRLTFADVLSELDCDDVERRRRAAYLLIRPGPITEGLRPGLLDGVVGRLLGDADPLLRSHGVAVVDNFDLPQLHTAIRELRETETDPWVRHHLEWCRSEGRTHTWDDFSVSAGRESGDIPPF